LLEEARQARLARFGDVLPIGRDDYTREVTEASKVDEDKEGAGRGTGVVCFLYKDGCVHFAVHSSLSQGSHRRAAPLALCKCNRMPKYAEAHARIPRSDRATEHVRLLVRKHPRTKFVSIVGDKCLPNLPDARVPMFIVYRAGEIVTQISSWGADRERVPEGALSFPNLLSSAYLCAFILTTLVSDRTGSAAHTLRRSRAARAAAAKAQRQRGRGVGGRGARSVRTHAVDGHLD
jgi:hypothetical protein